MSGSGAVQRRRGGVVVPCPQGSPLEPTLSEFDPRLKPPLHSALLSLFYPGDMEVQQCRREGDGFAYSISQHSATFHIQQRSSRYTSTDDVPYSGDYGRARETGG